MLESLLTQAECINQAYSDLAYELCMVGTLIKADENGPSGPYHLIKVSSKFVVLKRYNAPQQNELTGSICVAHDEAGALSLALGHSNSSAAMARWLVIPLPVSGACGWHTTALPHSPVTSREIAVELSRRLLFRWVSLKRWRTYADISQPVLQNRAIRVRGHTLANLKIPRDGFKLGAALAFDPDQLTAWRRVGLKCFNRQSCKHVIDQSLGPK